MSVEIFVLLDADTATTVPIPDRIDARSSGLSLNGSSDWHVSRRTLRGGLSDGVDVVELCSGPTTVSILPTRGMGLWKATRGNVTASWNSPVKRPVHPAFVDLGSRNGLGWLDGFCELLCRCGLAFNGPPGTDEQARSPIESQLTLHGKIANIPAHRVEVRIDDDGPGAISVIGVIDECTLFGPQLRLTSTVTLHAGSTSIRVEDRIENLGSSPTEVELLYHINVGPPFLEGRARLHLPAAEVAPRDPRAAEGIDTYADYLPPTPGYAEQAYFFELIPDGDGQTEALLQNSVGDLGFGLRFPREQLPCFTVWKCTQPEADGYVTGLEPGTNFPNFKTFERAQGRVMSLASGDQYVSQLSIDLHTSAGEVSESIARIDNLRREQCPVIHPQPAPGFSPVT